MTIRFTCSECSSVLKIKDELAGTTGRCPKCKTKFVVPAAGQPKAKSGSETPSTDHQIETITADSAELTAVKSTAANSDRPSTNEPEDRLPSVSRTGDSVDDAPLSLPLGGSESAFGDTVPLSGDDSDSPTIVDEPLVLGDDPEELQTDDDSLPLESSRQSLGFDEDDDLDSPPVLAGSDDSAVPTDPSPKPKSSPAPRSRDSKTNQSMKTTDQSKPSKKKPSDVAFDPLKYLASDSHSTSSDSPSLNMMDDSDLSLSDDSDYDLLGRPTPQPVQKSPSKSVAGKAAAGKPTPEKVDLASAAKMMKKAIKDAQADAARQRQLDANPGFDYGLFFREFGLRGLAIVVGLFMLVFGGWRVSSYIFQTQVRTPPLGIVRGTIKMNGQPLSNATIYFAPIETAIEGSKRERARTSLGVSDDKGNFKMMYLPLERIEGVAAGKCRVHVTHMGPKGDDIPSTWREGAMRIIDVPAGPQKDKFDIEMSPENRR